MIIYYSRHVNDGHRFPNGEPENILREKASIMLSYEYARKAKANHLTRIEFIIELRKQKKRKGK